MKRLYILTGKGGVGKTTISLALTKFLSLTKKNKVSFVSFNREFDIKVLQDLGLNFIDLDLKKSTEIYVGKKLGSQTIASWVMKTPFFSALYNMLPSLGQMVTLGHILDLLKDDPEQVIVLDSPASGHALSLFESTHNFKKIFGQGPIVQDIEKMHELLYNKDFLKTYILTLPTEMATQEGIELRSHLLGMNFKEVEILVNECLSANSKLDKFKNDLPEIILNKIQLEQQFLQTNEENLKVIPHLFTNDLNKLISALVPYMEDLV